jgi:UrcA family protein
MFRSATSAMLAVLAITMLGHAAACKASDTQPSEVKYDVIGETVVPMADLDLQKPADARVLLKRLDHAAYQACGGDPKFHASYAMTPRRVVAAFADCRAEAVRRAVDQIGNSTLTRLHADSRKKDHPVAARTP